MTFGSLLNLGGKKLPGCCWTADMEKQELARGDVIAERAWWLVTSAA